MERLRVGVLASGTGSLLESILGGQDEHYEVVVVLSDRPGVRALAVAEEAGVAAVVVDFPGYGKDRRPEFSAECARQMRKLDVGLACSAGFARILSPVWFTELGCPVLNSHPSLLPAFPGAHGVRDALAHGVKVTGTTIHFADEGTDTGPIIAQQAVPIAPDDTEESLHERIKRIERQLYPEVIRLYAQGRIVVEGRLVRVV